MPLQSQIGSIRKSVTSPSKPPRLSSPKKSIKISSPSKLPQGPPNIKEEESEYESEKVSERQIELDNLKTIIVALN